jgi:predicted oxidoreductase
MQTVKLGKSDLIASRLTYGCMRLVGENSSHDREKGKLAIRTAIEEGYTHFDHADVYGNGQCEALFAEVLKENPATRKNIIITSKCGIRQAGQPDKSDTKRYDFSHEHIIKSVEGSLNRLGIDCLDMLLLHRPDYLCNPQEVARTFAQLQASGKVLHFGVSNLSPSHVSMVQSCCARPLLVNQVQINIHNINSLTDGTLHQCQESTITPQAWSPLAGAAYQSWNNTFSAEDEARIKAELNTQGEKYNAPGWVVMLAWLLKHPAMICPIIGSTTPARIKQAKQALEIKYTREDWYKLLKARDDHAVP